MYEIAKELGVPSKDLLAKLSSMGVEAKSHS
ncbi:MAG TPA: translation initiation factor IF-2 N-terminal domain-containing protein, partial [Actinomycetota bacterium]|nr:translation initiation factor IF-2 N-terminal domain-containing protein [Actinomycetota bacterium]